MERLCELVGFVCRPRPVQGQEVNVGHQSRRTRSEAQCSGEAKASAGPTSQGWSRERILRTPEHRSLNGLHEARVNCEPTSVSALSAYDLEADLSGHHNNSSAPGQGDPWAEL